MSWSQREIDATMLRGTMLPGDPAPRIRTQTDKQAHSTGPASRHNDPQIQFNYPLFEYPGGNINLKWYEEQTHDEPNPVTMSKPYTKPVFRLSCVPAAG